MQRNQETSAKKTKSNWTNNLKTSINCILRPIAEKSIQKGLRTLKRTVWIEVLTFMGKIKILPLLSKHSRRTLSKTAGKFH